MPVTLTANGGIIFDPGNNYPVTSLGSDSSPYRNRVSNGNMVLSQRAVDNITTHPSTSAGASEKHYAADRFAALCYYASASNVINYRRTTGTTLQTPEGHTSYIRITNATNTALGSTDYAGIQTSIEGYDFYDSFFGGVYGVPFVLSFWVRSTVAGNYCVAFRNGTAARAYVTHYNIASANTWQKVYIPVPPCGDGTWSNSTLFGMNIFWGLSAGSSYVVPSGSESVWLSGNYLTNQYQTNFINQTAGQTFDLTGVCLERAPQSALAAYVLRNTTIAANGTTGLTLLQSGDFDDTFFTVSLPFAINLFGYTASTLYVSTNGYLGVDPAGAWGSIGTALVANTPAVAHVGFFKADKRLLTLYGGSRTITQQDGSSLSAYVLRWEGYNYGGSSANKTIVEFTFYSTSVQYENFSFFDVLYTTNANGTTYVELNPGHTNGAATGAYAREINTGTLGYRCYTKAFTAVRGTDVVNAPGVWWNTGSTPYQYAWSTTSLLTSSDSIQYTLGVSSGTSKIDSGIDHLRCLRYFEKTADESYVIPPSGNGASIGGNYGIYYRYKVACTTTSYIPLLYFPKRIAPTITTFSAGGSRGYVTLDNGGQAVVSYTFNIAERSCLTRVDYSTGISHYGYYGAAAIDADA